jgi:hypothetical protein
MKGAGIVILKKNGNVSNKKLNKHDNIIDALYSISDKRLKMSDKATKLYSYVISNTNSVSTTLEIYGYINGKAGQENSHDLPPNATCYCDGFDKSDTDLLFGEAYAIKYSGDKILDFEIDEYSKYYSKLCGGFEDLGDTDSELSEDEEPTQEDTDFIVPDDEELSTDEEWVEEESLDDEEDEEDDDEELEEDDGEDEELEEDDGEDDGEDEELEEDQEDI